VSFDSRGELVEAPVASPPSEGSSGIWTVRRGRLPLSWTELVREGGPAGGVKLSEGGGGLMVFVECGGGDLIVPLRESREEEEVRLVSAGSPRVDSGAEVDEIQCWERMERDSSMGVKMLRDLTDGRLGSSICPVL
jgi:hypothetical protein